MSFSYEIHYTGSKGNCVTINGIGGDFNMMVDAGKPYKYIEPYLYNISFLLYTHRHS